MKVQTLDEALAYLHNYIPKTFTQTFKGDWGIKRVKKLLALLGNPQNTLHVIHVAGTSGKGSTCHMISGLLQQHGFKVGLAISPHMYDIRERSLVNNTLLSEETYCRYLSEIIPAIEHIKVTEWGSPTYFEITVALTFYIFAKEQVDYAVIETGLGGLYDATNVVDRPDKVAVITTIGLDHTNILGKTLPEIAFQKAGIIKNNNMVIAAHPRPQVKKVFEERVKRTNASLYFVEKKKHIQNVQLKENNVSFDFSWDNISYTTILLNIKGIFQIENAALALATICTVAQRDGFTIEEDSVRKALGVINVFGRFQVFTKADTTILVDGAHNPQKMSALVKSITKLYPRETFDIVIAFKKTKDFRSMLQILLPIARSFTITSFGQGTHGYEVMAVEPEEIQAVLKKMGVYNIHIIHMPQQALDMVIAHSKNVLVTGSLYLLSELYKSLTVLSKD